MIQVYLNAKEVSMSRRKEKIDPNQMQFDFNFEERVEQYITAREQITDAIENGPTVLEFESEMEISIEIAAEVKRAIRE